MGVPAFFRWLSRKYPSVIIDCVEDTQFKTEDGTRVPVDATKPNPNGVEFDNLYLDMNGIIHPCTHPEDKPAPRNEDEMMVAIFECIDRLFSIVRPRKLLYMAIDGVAPRAKMNQQRSRRFRASKEAFEKTLEVARLRQELQEKGYKVPPEKPKESHFDSNCITPGTPFMDRLSKCLHYYVHDRLNTDPAWRNIKIVLSDANVPGEGEHKIMDYIRRQRAQPDHDPDTHHVLCGADADLIMLGLATHELNFTIIREEFKPNKPKPCDICGLLGHEMVDCLGVEGDSAADEPEKVYEEQKYIFVRLNVLREYLERELSMPNLPFKYDFDRAIDDWVFMCFFVGNDFLPHLPSLEIRENAIDRLVNLYKDCCYKTGGWLTDSGSANMRRVQMILQNLGKAEDQIFKNRQRKELEFKARDRAQKRQKMEKEAAYRFLNQTGQGALGVMKAGDTAVAHGAKGNIMQQRLGNMGGRGIKRGHSDVDGEEEEEENHDEVRLYEDGFKDRYYESKFEVTAENLEFRRRVADEYARGLCWVLKYYYQGCVSWNWYFPYHYAPFASDFVNCANANVNFDKGEPFNPLEQLMGVFPAASRSHVPEPWGELMIKADSNIIDFYPEDFKIDLNGKKFAWQGVALLPFVDEVRLKRALEEVYPLLTDEETRRNKRGDARLYVSCKHSAYTQLCDMYRMGMNFDTEVPISGDEYQGVQGKVLLAGDVVEPNGVLQAPVQGLPLIRDNQVVTVRFRDPSYPEGFVFPSRKLENAEPPPRVLKGDNVGSGPPGSYRPQIGFSRNLPQASLGAAGHRALGHHVNRGRGGGQYSNVPPPSGMSGSRGGRGGGTSLLGAPPGNFQMMNQSANYQGYGGGGGQGGRFNQNKHHGGGGGYSSSKQGGGYNSSQWQSQVSRGGNSSYTGVRAGAPPDGVPQGLHLRQLHDPDRQPDVPGRAQAHVPSLRRQGRRQGTRPGPDPARGGRQAPHHHDRQLLDEGRGPGRLQGVPATGVQHTHLPAALLRGVDGGHLQQDLQEPPAAPPGQGHEGGQQEDGGDPRDRAHGAGLHRPGHDLRHDRSGHRP